ncbi:Vps5-domain-containing protein [Martensiomyces pterosporus]|nr:Vps5-domain-containing protein [Martensiomyces pterosporus]
MESDNLFSGGFGASGQPFTFDSDEMNPFGEASSPWGDAPPAERTNETPAITAAAGQSDQNEEEDSGDERGISELQQAAEQLDLGSQPDSYETATSDKHALETAGEGQETNSQASDANASEKENAPALPDSATSSKSQAKAAAAPLPGYGAHAQTARRVGVIRRGLKSPRVLGTQVSSGPFEDPLSSAAAENSDMDNDVVAAPARASADAAQRKPQVSPQHQPRQVRSLSEASSTNSGSGHVHASKATVVQPTSPPPHPYDQQLAPAQQQEQAIHSRQQADSTQPRSTTLSERPSTGSAASRQSTTSRVYLGVHQRRRSLDPTPADQIPKFSIQIMDPVKVSDSLKSYIAYKVKTQSDAPAFRESEMTVRRRYRDFDWLIQELIARHPGVIVPAIPEKQSMGRFEDEFVESRRAGLESCLTRISEHPILWADDVFRLFLEADDFAAKARAITENRITAEINGTSSSLSSGGSGGGGGLFGDGWGAAKYKEKDEWFAKRMQELDAMEEELRALLRALEYSQRQRRELSIAHGELGEAYLKMAGQELNKSLSNGLTDMGSLQQKLKVLQSRQGVADFAAFQLTTDEYIRIIGAVRTAFSARGRAYSRWQSSLADLIKKRKVLEGYVQHPSRASPERMAQLKGEIARAEIRTEGNRNAFDDVSQILKHEMARFDANRVRDFQAAVESYLMSLIDTQEEIVMLWEAYLTSVRNSEHGHSEGGPVAQ